MNLYQPVITCNPDADEFESPDFSPLLPGKTLEVTKGTSVTIIFKRKEGTTPTSVEVCVQNLAGELTDVLFGTKSFTVTSSTTGHPMPVLNSAPIGEYTISRMDPERGPLSGMAGTIKVSTGA